jgi:polysaccharide deacetylase family sporulation protein PdaB
MQYFYQLDFRKWKRWGMIIVFALFTATFLWFEQNGTYSVFSKKEPNVFSKGDINKETIALTFNISWGEERVFDILKQLETEQVQATFFVSGEWAERHPDILNKIAENKHELGMLGYRYKSYLDQEIGQIRKDLHYAQEVFKKLGYPNVDQLRTPSGHFNKEIIALAEQLGLKVIHWNINPHDWKNPGTETIVNTIMEQTTNGDILLLHASDSVKQTDKALQTVLPGLKNKGFKFVTVSELFSQAHSESNLIE